MKTFAISTALALMATLAQAAPSPSANEARQADVEVLLTFAGAGPTPPTYTLTERADGHFFSIDNPLGVSHISSSGGANCVLFGTEGSTTVIIGARTVDVGPPQPQASGYCTAA